jgi:signal transduction histidine kinase
VMEGSLRRLWGGSMPLPLSIRPDQAAEGENELSLVQTEAELLDAAPAGLTGVRLNFRGGYQTFAAILPNSKLDEELPANFMQPGARLRLTGILFVNHDPNGSRDEAFTLELRSPQDLELVEGPSWWTSAHIALLAGSLVIFVLISMNLITRLSHARYRAVAEERANIARDIHDTLAQSFAGMTLQLEAADRTIERDPAQSKAFLREALQMARHSRNESHISIEILHSMSRDERLDVLIANCISKMQVSTGFKIERQVRGEPIPLSYRVVNNLVRIGQEAIANAVLHSEATLVNVRIVYGKKDVLLEVEDNGNGFDPTCIPGPNDGHFGLTGMRERAAAIGSILQLESTATGTLMRVRVAA